MPAVPQLFIDVREKVKAVDISRSHELRMYKNPVLQFAHCSNCEEERSGRLSASWLFTCLIWGSRIAVKAVFLRGSCSHADEKTGQYSPASSGEVQPPG